MFFIRIRQFPTFLKIDDVIGPPHPHPSLDALRKKSSVLGSLSVHTRLPTLGLSRYILLAIVKRPFRTIKTGLRIPPSNLRLMMIFLGVMPMGGWQR